MYFYLIPVFLSTTSFSVMFLSLMSYCPINETRKSGDLIIVFQKKKKKKKKKERKKEKEKEKKKMQERTVVLGLKLDHYWLCCLSPQNWEVCLCNILIKNFRFLLNCFVREIKGFYQSSLGNEVDYRDIINVSPNILAKN